MTGGARIREGGAVVVGRAHRRQVRRDHRNLDTRQQASGGLRCVAWASVAGEREQGIRREGVGGGRGGAPDWPSWIQRGMWGPPTCYGDLGPCLQRYRAGSAVQRASEDHGFVVCKTFFSLSFT